MPTWTPVPDKSAGDIFTELMWDEYIRDNLNKLLNQGHRVLTVAQFGALTGLEDGDEVYLEVDATNGIVWHLRYVAAEPTYKWRFLGGPPLYSEVAAAETTGSTGAYVALTTAGPSITTPRAGDYDVAVVYSVAAGGGPAWMSYDIGGTGALDDDGAAQNPAGAVASTTQKTRRKPALAASTALVAKYKAATANFTADHRGMYVRPVRVS